MRVVLLVDLHAQERFENVFERDHAGEGAELVDDDRQLLVGADKVMQGIGEGRVLRDDVGLPHELADLHLAAALAGGLQDIAAAHDADDAVGVAFPDRQPAMRDARIHPQHIADREVDIDRGDDRTGREDLGNGDVIQAHGVRHQGAFGLRDLALARRRLRQAADIRIRAVDARLFRGRQGIMQFTEAPQHGRGPADQGKRRGDPRRQRDAEVHPELAGQHDRQPRHQEGNGDDRRDDTQGDLPAGQRIGHEPTTQQDAAQQGAHADERRGEDFEGGQGVALVAPTTLQRHGRLRILAAQRFDFPRGKGRDDAGHQRNAGGAAVQEDKDGPKKTDVHMTADPRATGWRWRGRIPTLTAAGSMETMRS